MQTRNTHEGKWGTGENTQGSGKTIRLVTQEEEQVTWNERRVNPSK